ncbi:hypothetical protein M8J75_002754 [Diaphorina citri]|nr:hypothetical protein M8J75_002754 [Diaphorina citri]
MSRLTCKETVWSQDRAVVRLKLVNCIKLNRQYHATYQMVKEHNFIPNAEQFSFSENYVFGKFDVFCERLSKIIAMFDSIDDYNYLFDRRMEGLLLGEPLEEAMKVFTEIKNKTCNKDYDYLDQRNSQFDEDFQDFLRRTNQLKEKIGAQIEENFANVWESPQGIKFLTRFEQVSEKIPITRMDEKYFRVLKYCELEVDRILKLFKKQKDAPPLARNYPPVAGRITWARSLNFHLAELVESASQHHVLKTLHACTELARRYTTVAQTLQSYEKELIDIWMNHDVWVVEECLKKNILALNEASGKLEVNLDHRITLLIRECDCLLKMKIPVPVVTLAIFSKRDYFTKVTDSLEFLLDSFFTSVQRVKLEVRPLFLPPLVRLTSMLHPALSILQWTDRGWRSFVRHMEVAVQNFDVLVTRVHDIYTNRILQVLASMQTELNRKSLMVEEAVEEVLELVKKEAEIWKANNADTDTFFDTLLDETSSNVSKPSQGIEPSGTPTQQQDWSSVYECFENPQNLLRTGGGLSKAMQEMVLNAVSEMRRYYSRKVIDVLIKVTRTSLDTLRRRFTLNTGPPPIFLLDAKLRIPSVVISPPLEEVQEALITAGKHITGVAKGVAQWTGGEAQQKLGWKRLAGSKPPILSQQVGEIGAEPPPDPGGPSFKFQRKKKPSFPLQPRNFYSHVMENKEVVKTLSLLSTCTLDIKPALVSFVEKWSPYKFLWENEMINRRDVTNVGLVESEHALRRHGELEAELNIEPDLHTFGSCIVISVEQLKFGLMTEINSCNRRIAFLLRKKYHREMDYVYAVMNEMDRKLDRTITDLDDVRMIMELLKRIRDQEVDMELKIEPIEEAYNVITRYDLPVDKEDLEQVDSLRYTWQKLLARAMTANVLLTTMQPRFEQDLADNLAQFRQDKVDYCHEYRTSGPMMPGLSPREASDRLILFQNRFDGMWRKLQTYQSGEELFGLPTTDYPELAQIRKELNLLQKLYKLYNDVIDRVSSYYDIPWGEVNIEEINNELMEFQNRCRKLPKGLKEWPAFHALKRTIDDFNDMCPLLELMANKAMKPRHWQRIMEVTKYNFELDSESFCLKNILEAPLLKCKEDIEDICISAMKEKDIEAKLRQVTNEWSVHELTFMTFNNRGELLLRGDTTAETIGQLEDSLMVLGSLLSNRYNAPFRKQIQQWVFDLSNTNEILERWLLVQNMWVYLEAVFVGGDIAKQLPKEAKR